MLLRAEYLALHVSGHARPDTKNWDNCTSVGLKLGQRRRRKSNMKVTLGYRLVFDGYLLLLRHVWL